jgi:hypothetical protein
VLYIQSALNAVWMEARKPRGGRRLTPAAPAPALESIQPGKRAL